MCIKFLITGILTAISPMVRPIWAQVPSGCSSIVYEITIKKTNSKGGIEETYNGGTRTVFISHNKARIRLASLMRTESIYFNFDGEQPSQVTMLKESGPQKYSCKLMPAQWQDLNVKYKDVVCLLTHDSLVIAGYLCRKALLTLNTGEQITAYYDSSSRGVSGFVEPLFKLVPGIVLQYEVESEQGNLLFKAAMISHQDIAPEVFAIPVKGIAVKKYNARKSS